MLDVLFWPREEGEPVFPPEKRERPMEYLRDLAVKRGLPHQQAVAWAKEAYRKGMRKGDGKLG